ncbi:potassium uptake protein Trk family [Dialister sp. CAG:486]|nr:potassium uptake protein Trk family [Dialister sp. CAG:486]
MDPAIITLCVLAVAAFLFITELIPLAVTAMAACTMLGILGVLPSKAVYAGLSNAARGRVFGSEKRETPYREKTVGGASYKRLGEGGGKRALSLIPK